MHRLAFALALVALVVAPRLAAGLEGKVVAVGDGDTITVLAEGREVRIRLYGIDTPEKRQAFGTRAKERTSDLVYGKSVRVVEKATDRYGRTVGLVYVDGTCVNEQLVRDGFAWLYEHFCTERFCRDWKRLEKRARRARLGLWRDPDPEPPWEWRRSDRGSDRREGGDVTPPTPPSPLVPPVPRVGSAPTRPTMLPVAAVPPAPPGAAAPGPYHGNDRSGVFHGRGCEHYDCRSCTLVFRTRTEAVRSGFRPCGRCRP